MESKKNNKFSLSLRASIPVALVLFSVGFLAGMEYKAYQVRKTFNKGAKEIENAFKDTFNTTETGLQEDLKDKKIIEKGIGDVVQFTTIEMAVESVEEKTIFNRSYDNPLVAREGAKFIVVSMNVKNITEGKFNFQGGDIKLVDGKDREYEPSNDLYSSDGNLIYQDLSPDLMESGILLYEVPENSSTYAIFMGKAGTNEVYKITLK